MRIFPPRTWARVVVLTGAGALVAACSAPAANTSATGKNGKPVPCSPAAMTTVTKGKLTVATDNPALEPWFIGNDPTSGEGFESGIAYRIAVTLGYDPHNVVWRRVPFAQIIAPGAKNFDFALDEVTVRADRAKNVDFSTPYLDITQAVVTERNSSLAAATSVSQLRGAKFGALNDTTSLSAVTNEIKPTTAATVFSSMAQAIAAMQDGRINALVTDLPTAFYIAQGRLAGSVVVGQLPPHGGEEQIAAVLQKGSSNTACVDQALAKLTHNGTLGDLKQHWIVYRGAPILKDG